MDYIEDLLEQSLHKKETVAAGPSPSPQPHTTTSSSSSTSTESVIDEKENNNDHSTQNSPGLVAAGVNDVSPTEKTHSDTRHTSRSGSVERGSKAAKRYSSRSRSGERKSSSSSSHHRRRSSRSRSRSRNRSHRSGRRSHRSRSREGDSRRRRRSTSRRRDDSPKRRRRDHSRDRGGSRNDPSSKRNDDGKTSRESSPGPELTAEERDARTVFVMQLSNRLKQRELAEFFEQAGKVRKAVIIYDKKSGRSKGVGYIEFVETESVARALLLKGQKLLGIPILVELTEAEKNRVAEAQASAATAAECEPFKIYVGSIHFSFTEENIKQIFEPFGAIESVNLHRDVLGKSKGYCFIQYKSVASAKQAIAEMNGFELGGRPLKVNVVNNVAGVNGGANVTTSSGSSIINSAVAKAVASLNQVGTSLDDGEISLNSHARTQLMAKLSRDSGLFPAAQAVNPKPHAMMPVNPVAPAAPHIAQLATKCLLLKNVFDPSEESEPDWHKEIEEDVKMECSKFGPVVHIYVEKESQDGHLYIKFGNVQASETAFRNLDGRFFAAKKLSAAFIPDAIYNARFPNST